MRELLGLMVNFAVVFAPVVAIAQVADERATEKAAPKQKPWMQYCSLSLSEYRLALTADPNVSFELAKQPAFVHVDEVDASRELGLLYVWTDKRGRSIAAITSVLMTWSNGKAWSELHEYHSLCDEPLEMIRDGRKIWTPPGPGLDWKEVPKGPKPAENKVQRQLQAKAIARRFKARGESRAGKLWDFRLLPRPVHSYDDEEGNGKLASGSLFIFCRGTDPEVLIKLELRPSSTGEPRWHYGIANFTNMVSSVSYDGVDVWVDDPAAAPSKPHGSHFPSKNFDFKSRLEAMLTEPDTTNRSTSK
ncbi:MAG: hypothetical protein H8E66_30505 [Planctomycetes bacterium]|nr:hypothetical protein [Planctomycetota bacterium]